VKKACKIGGSALVRKIKRTLLDAKVLLDEPEDAAEVIPKVVNVSLRSVGRDYQQRYPEAVLIVALALLRHRQQSRGLVIIPTSPVVPGNNDCRVLPISQHIAIYGVGALALANL